jgi:bifunctional ADP-heptose synthase (sugar kinase/adenylyltransferase)
VIEPSHAPRELSRIDSKNWTKTPESLSRKLASGLTQIAGPVDALILLDQVVLPETGVVTSAVREAALAALRARTNLVVLADSRRGLQEYPAIGFKMNAAELGRMAGADAFNLDAVKCLSANLAQKNRQPVFVTLAERGIVGALPDRSPEHVPAHSIRGPIDIVGAGDAVTANLAAALAAGAGIREAMELAMAAASVVIHQLGTTGTASVAQIAQLSSQAASTAS